MKIVQCEKAPCDGAVEQLPGVWLVTDDAKELSIGASEIVGETAKNTIKPRYDLDKSHPLYGKRALYNVPAGMLDVVVNDSGVVVNASELTATPVVIDDGR